MKINRLICFVMALVLSVSMAYMPTFADEAAKVSDIEFLNELGVVKGYEDGKLHPEYNITRMEYAALIIRCLGYDGNYPSVGTVFTDVPKDSWGAAAVQFAYDLGIINGYGDGRFGPDDNILEVDAVKIIVSALGRGLEAEASGGYPTGYLSIAQKLKLMSDYKGGEEKATRGFVATLIANALDVSIVEQNFTSNAFMENNGRTFLSILGLSRYNGILTAVNGVNIGSEENVLADEIVISGKRFKTDKIFSGEFVGNEVSAYVYKYGKTEEKVIAMFVSKYSDKTLTVDAKDISYKTNLKKFVYTDKNKEKEIDLPAGFLITYNGTLLNKSVYITPDKLKPLNGYVKLIDTNRDDLYDYAIVKDYKTYVVRSVSEDTIYDVYGNNITFDMDEENSLIVVKKDDKVQTWEDIEPGSVLSVASNMENTVVEILISDDVVSEQVVSTATRDDKLCYGVSSGMEYCTTSEYNDAILKLYREAKKIEIGNKYTFKLNEFGEIAYVMDYTYENEEGEILTSTNINEKYGYLCTAGLVKGAMNTDLEVKLLTTNNRLEIFTIPGGGKVRYGRMVGRSYVIGRIEAADIYPDILNEEDNIIIRQIVKYVLNEDGTIKEFYLADSRTNSENLSMDVNRTSRTFSFNTINQKYYYDEKTVLFVLTGNGQKDYNIICTTPAKYLTNRASYNSELWDIDSNGYINCICLYPEEGGTIWNTVELFVLDVVNDPVMLITNIYEELNDEGISYKIVEGYEDGKKVKRIMSEELTKLASTIIPGMIIQYATNKENLSYALYAADDEVMVGYQIMFDCTEKNQEPFVLYDHKESKRSFRMNYGYGTISRVDFPTLTISPKDIKTKLHGEVMVLRYNSRTGAVEMMDITQIVEGQKVFFRQRLDNLRDIIIIE